MLDLNDFQELDPYLSQLDKAQLEELYFQLCDYAENPVDINTFLDDPKYLGSYFEGNLYPYWRKVLNDIFPSPHYSPFWLIAFRGSIGQGKTSVACAGLVYELYRLLCLNNPQKANGLVPSTTILFAIFNVTLSLSVDVVWDKISQMFASSPYFSSLTGLLGARKKRGETLFPKRIDFFMGSRIGHSLGKAVYNAILSESNFSIIENQTYDTFNSLLRRMQSRFMAPEGVGIPFKFWIDSSETDNFSVMNKIIDQYKNNKGVYVSQAPIWNVVTQKNGKSLYSGKKFWVHSGSDLKQPKILGEGDQELTDESEFCIQVPIEHKDSFEADIVASLRDIAGVSTTSNYKVFRLKDRLARAMTVSPLFPEIIKLDFDDDQDQLINYTLVKNYFSKPLNPNIPRNLHIDIGLTGDRLGIAATYVAGFKDRTVRDINSFEEISENIPYTITEWAIGIEPRPGKQVPLFKIRLFISMLSKMGYPIGLITLDGFQSADFLQVMTKEGFECEIVSTDKKIDPYMILRSLIYEGRTMLPIHSILETELKELEMSSDGQKIDHPEKTTTGIRGSKDIADAVAGSTSITIRDAHKHKLLHLVEPKHKSPIGEELKEYLWPVNRR